ALPFRTVISSSLRSYLPPSRATSPSIQPFGPFPSPPAQQEWGASQSAAARSPIFVFRLESPAAGAEFRGGAEGSTLMKNMASFAPPSTATCARIHGQYRTSGLPCDTSMPSSATSNSLRTTRSICLENAHRLRNLHVSYAGGNSSERVIINGKANPSNAVQADAVALGTIAADMAPVVDGFSADDDELDLDSPTEGFSSIPEAIEDIRQGKYVIVVDDEDRENEGDLIMAASKVTPEAMAFIVRHGTGIVCVSMKEEDLERLQLPHMVTTKENEEKLRT
ncbi:unnamed protein product, partial [Urochloa humidicola]